MQDFKGKFRQDKLSDFLDRKIQQVTSNGEKAKAVSDGIKQVKERLFFMNVEQISIKTQRLLGKISL